MKVITKDGREYYEKPDGTLIIKSMYDAYYGVNRLKAEILPFGTKGENPDKTKNWMKGKKSY